MCYRLIYIEIKPSHEIIFTLGDLFTFNLRGILSHYLKKKSTCYVCAIQWKIRLNYKRPTSQILFPLLKRCIIKHHHAISYSGTFYISIRTQLKIARSEFRKIGEHCETKLLCSVYGFLQDSIFLKSTHK